jgi:hypothetical protein
MAADLNKRGGRPAELQLPFQFYLPLTLQHLKDCPTSRKISKLKAISIKLTLIHLRYFCLVNA